MSERGPSASEIEDAARPPGMDTAETMAAARDAAGDYARYMVRIARPHGIELVERVLGTQLEPLSDGYADLALRLGRAPTDAERRAYRDAFEATVRALLA